MRLAVFHKNESVRIVRVNAVLSCNPAPFPRLYRNEAYGWIGPVMAQHIMHSA